MSLTCQLIFLSLLQSRNYGDYANADGELPVCFIAANHTSGGNSGSPAFNAKGELIGLNFDRIWEGTMSDFYFTPERCRNIMVGHSLRLMGCRCLCWR